MLKKMKKMKHSTLISIVIAMVFVFLLTSVTAVEFCTLPKAEPDGVINRQSNLFGSAKVSQDAKAVKSAKVKKPGQVKGLKKVKTSCKWDGYRNDSSIKIRFNKVKGAIGYQILIYQKKIKGLRTPLVYAKTTKNTTYTIKGLTPGGNHTIKVRAYTKGKHGKIIYGKTKTIKVKTSGEKKGLYFVCNTCAAIMSGNMLRMNEHCESVYKVCKETHAGGTYNWYY